MARAASPTRGGRDVRAALVEHRSRRARLRRRRRQVVLWVVLAGLVGVTSFGAGLLAAPVDYNFQPVPPTSVLLLDSQGKVFASIRSPQDQEPVSSQQIPVVLKEAVVAAEDARFFSHSGVDPLSVVRALWNDVTGSHLQGGSTITQQYVKNVYTGSQRTALRKLREASLAIRLEQHLSKDEILTRYLNTLYLGNGTAGVQAASKYYFGVPVTDLDLDRKTGQRSDALALGRAATLAGMIPAPSLWNPVRDPKIAYTRELYVLNRMIQNHLITPQQASEAVGNGLPRIVAKSAPDAPTIAPEFRDYVAAQLRGTLAFTPDTLFETGGVKVRTTLDLDLQKAAVHALATVLRTPSDPEAAVVAVDPRNGDIRALTTRSARGYKTGGFDLATNASRSSGSTIKPFTLAVALQRGHSVDEVRPAPQCVEVPYHVCNAETGSSYQTLRSAMVSSINTVYGPLGVELGLDRIVKLMRASGVDVAPLQRGSDHKPFPAQALGVQVTPLSEAVGYGTLVNHGLHHAARSVLKVSSGLDGDLYAAPKDPPGNRVLPAGVADQVTQVLQGVVDAGTGTAARQPFPVYGKTGTTDDFTNAWFTGCTPTLCITVWMGYDKQYLNGGRVPHSMRNVEGVPEVFGGTLPAKIFAQTWQDYRTLQQPQGTLSPTPSPVPPRTVVTVPTRSPSTPTRSARPTRSSPPPSPRPSPSRTPSPAPSPSASPTLLPTARPPRPPHN